MTIISKSIQLSTSGNCDIVNITSEVVSEVSNSGLSNGAAIVFVTGSTAGVTTIEYEAGLVIDLKEMWEKLVPEKMEYKHDRAWGDGNGYSHVRASLLGPCLTIPFINRKLALGTWQQVVLIDFDNRVRSREIIIQVIGE
jgi:secondary thiamine-phosphate synthase enzyme